MAVLRKLAASPGCVSIGECGLDYDRMFSPREVQLQWCREQVELAVELEMPLFLHERDRDPSKGKKLGSAADLQEILQDSKVDPKKVCVHCFTGSKEDLQHYVAQGYFIGLTGFAAMKRRGAHIRQMLEAGDIPVQQLMLETDCPFMMPDKEYLPDVLGIAGRKNEPCSMPAVCRAVAECLKIPPEQGLKAGHEKAFEEAMMTPVADDLQRVELFTRSWIHYSMGKIWQAAEQAGLMNHESMVEPAWVVQPLMKENELVNDGEAEAPIRHVLIRDLAKVAAATKQPWPLKEPTSLLLAFDGDPGAAEHCAKNLHARLLRRLKSGDAKALSGALSGAVLDLDSELRDQRPGAPGCSGVAALFVGRQLFVVLAGTCVGMLWGKGLAAAAAGSSSATEIGKDSELHGLRDGFESWPPPGWSAASLLPRDPGAETRQVVDATESGESQGLAWQRWQVALPGGKRPGSQAVAAAGAAAVRAQSAQAQTGRQMEKLRMEERH
eukprot:Skav222241  [mRNA]  locus=scaffold3059:165090:175699:- [translate_table: standard]